MMNIINKLSSTAITDVAFAYHISIFINDNHVELMFLPYTDEVAPKGFDNHWNQACQTNQPCKH